MVGVCDEATFSQRLINFPFLLPLGRACSVWRYSSERETTAVGLARGVGDESVRVVCGGTFNSLKRFCGFIRWGRKRDEEELDGKTEEEKHQ